MAPSSDEIREEISETRARLDHDIGTLQDKFKRTAEPIDQVRENPLPFVVGALGLGLLLATLFVRRREAEPPLPPKGSRRRQVAHMVESAEDEGLLSEEARRILISLLTVQGLEWLKKYLEEESKGLAQGAQHAAASAKSRAGDALHEATERVSEAASEARSKAGERLGEAEERASGKAHAVSDSMSEGAQSLKESVAERLHTLAESVTESASAAKESATERLHAAQERLHGAGEEAKETVEEQTSDGANGIKERVVALQEAATVKLSSLRERGEEAAHEGAVHATEAAQESAAEAEQRGSSFINRILRR